MNRETARAARKAKRFVRTDEPINWSAVEAHENALRTMERPALCPCCSFLWDQAEAEAMLATGKEAYRAWLYRTLELAANAVGESLGERGNPITLGDF